MSHALLEHLLPGIDSERLKRLTEAGIDSLEGVVDAGAENLANLTGFDIKTSRALVRIAQSALKEPPQGVIELVPRRTEPPTARLVRGLEAARRIEDVVSLVRKARSRVGKKPGKRSWKSEHGRARKQLRKLSRALEVVQRAVLGEGISAPAQAHLEDQLAPLEVSLQSVLDAGPLKKAELKRLGRVSKLARHRLDASSMP